MKPYIKVYFIADSGWLIVGYISEKLYDICSQNGDKYNIIVRNIDSDDKFWVASADKYKGIANIVSKKDNTMRMSLRFGEYFVDDINRILKHVGENK